MLTWSVPFSFYLTVDLQIDRHEKALSLSLEDKLAPVRLMLMKKQTELLTDEFGWRFIDSVVNGNGTVFVDPPSHFFPEMVFQVPGRRPDQFDMPGKAIEG